MNKLEQYKSQHIDAINALDSISEEIEKAVNTIIAAFRNNKKLLICGNGGSAADAQHIAAELVGRFRLKRRALPAIALSTDTSLITAWTNDYEFDTVFSRQVEALGETGDILIAISTSGNSANVLSAAQEAKSKGMIVIALTGNDGGKLKQHCSILLNAKSNITSIIQEIHQVTYHYICQEIENHYYRDI